MLDAQTLKPHVANPKPVVIDDGNVFSEIYTIDVERTTNRELFASNNPHMVERLQENVAKEDNDELINMMKKVEDNLERYQPGNLILTDDKAPVELLGMKVIDDLIGDDVAYYKDIYNNEGIDGLINSFE